MDILWSPEPGRCTECGGAGPRVRRYTAGGIHRVFCHGCWTRSEQGCHISRRDWAEDESLVFVYPGDEVRRPGTAQGAFLH